MKSQALGSLLTISRRCMKRKVYLEQFMAQGVGQIESTKGMLDIVQLVDTELKVNSIQRCTQAAFPEYWQL